MQLDLVPIIKHIFQTYYGKPTNSITSNLQLNEDSKLDQVGQPNVQQAHWPVPPATCIVAQCNCAAEPIVIASV